MHPDAAQKLLEILKSLGHQYIITTHSSEIVRWANPDVLLLTKSDGRESIIETLNGSNVLHIRTIIQEIGVRLSDVFGADKVLWVEGQTEELCFPKLLTAAGRSLSPAIAVIAIVNTGDFEARRVRDTLVWEIYKTLTVGSTLVPPALAFSFDRETRTDIERQDMERS